MERIAQLRRNIILLRTIKAIGMAMLTIPIIVIYFQQHGLSMEEVMWLQAIFSATMIAIEIPSGYFSDVLGRKRTIIIGTAMATAGWTLYAFVDTFTGFLVAELILGVGAAFISGTDSAMLYDTLLDLGEESTAVYQEGRMLAGSHFSEAAAAVVGGLLAAVSMHLPFYIQILVFLPLVPLALMLVEPAEHRNAGQRVGFRDIYDTVAHVVITDHRLRWMLLTASLLGASTLTVLWMYQPYWEMVGVPVSLFGLIWAGGNVLVGVASLRAASITKRIGEKNTIGILIAGVALAMVLIGLFPSFWIMPLFAVFYITRGLSNPIFTSRINKRVVSSRRATVLSVRQLGVRTVFVALGPVIGGIGDSTGLTTAFMVSAAIFGTTAGVTYIIWIRAVAAGKRAALEAAQ